MSRSEELELNDAGAGRLADVVVDLDDGMTPAELPKEPTETAKGEKRERFNAFDCLLSSLLVAAFECVLKKRKELMKEMPSEAIRRLCHSLLETLSHQDAVLLQICTIVEEKQAAVEQQLGDKDYKSKPQKTEASKNHEMISIRSVNDETYREACLRFLSQLCFENCGYVPDESVASIYNYVSKLAFMHEAENR